MVACLRNNWAQKYFEGDYEAIFASEDFRNHIVFEDQPWWCGHFYKFLFHRFPDARFVFGRRNADCWFDSLMHMSKRHEGVPELNTTHCLHLHEYQRNGELPNGFVDLLQQAVPLLTEFDRAHYTKVYNARNNEVLRFFERNDPTRMVHFCLEDPEKWKIVTDFFDMELFDVHENKTRKEIKKCLL
jgi:hypothetical protein